MAVNRRKRLFYLSFDPSDALGSALVRSVYARTESLGMDLCVVDGGVVATPVEWFNKRNILFRWIERQRIDAILVSGIFQFMTSEKKTEFMGPFSGIPAVGISERIPGAPSVLVDNGSGFRELLLHLIADCGCGTFAVITGPEENPDSIERFEVLRRVFKESGIALPPENVFVGTFGAWSGTDAVAEFLDARKLSFDALVCFNDRMAVAAMRELARRGLKVPDDVMVTGFDDDFESAFSVPSLTTVSYSLQKLGEASVDIARDMIEGRTVPDTTILESRLVVRGSTRKGGRRSGRSDRGEAPDPDFLLSWMRRFCAQEAVWSQLALMAEDFTAALDMDSIPRILSKYSTSIGIRDCFVVAYSSPRMDAARLIARIEGGRAMPPEEFGEFSPEDLLPDGLAEKFPALVLEALYVQGDDLGYILFNLGDHPPVLFRNLRHQVSTAMKTARLLEEVNAYSEGLEKMVEERTEELRNLNAELKSEIELRGRAEGELLKAKNLESLAYLAGGIAHDFNNFLTAIAGNASLLRSSPSGRGEASDLVDGMMEAVEKAKGLTRQLLTFAKGGVPVKKVVSIGPLVRETILFMLRGSSVKPDIRFPDAPLNAEIDPGQIAQVLNNLTINALQAMPEGGELRVFVDACGPPGGIGSAGAPGWLRIAVQDSGPGIPPEIADKVFDPYFTTKEKGSGLGLSTSLAIVEKHGGLMRMSAPPGGGALFEIFLPATDKATVNVGGSAKAGLPPGIKVLALDDDSSVRKIIEAFCDRLGILADITEDGAETVSRYGEALGRGEPYDIVLADLTIPGGMGGKDAMARILALDPGAAGIVMSGYSDVPVLSEFASHGFRAALLKPFTLEEFVETMGEVVDSARGEDGSSRS